MDEATARFLETLADDLQRQIGMAGSVEGIELQGAPPRVTLTATVAVGERMLVFGGTGETVVAAYHELGRTAPEPILATAWTAIAEGR